MKPETRRAFNAALLEHFDRPVDGGIAQDMFIAGMMEAARLCREYAATTSPVRGIQCAELIESSAKGE